MQEALRRDGGGVRAPERNWERLRLRRVCICARMRDPGSNCIQF